MKNFKVISLLVSIILVSIFAVQNSLAVTIRFLVWKMEMSQALVIVLTVAMGILIGLGVSFMKSLKHSKDIRQANNEKQSAEVTVMALEKENAQLKLTVNELEKKIDQSKHQE